VIGGVESGRAGSSATVLKNIMQRFAGKLALNATVETADPIELSRNVELL